MTDVLNPTMVRRRAADLSAVLKQRGLVLGERNAQSGKHQIIAAKVGPGGRGVDPTLVVAGVGNQSLTDLLGRYLVLADPAPEKLAEWIVQQFEIAASAA